MIILESSPFISYFNSFIEFSPLPMALLNNDLIYLTYNKKWVNMLGLRGKKILRNNHFQNFSGSPKNLTIEVRKILSGEIKSIDGQIFDFIDLKGKLNKVKINIHPWKNKRKIEGIITTVHLVTEDYKKEIKLKESSELFANLLKHNPLAVAMFDTKMRYVAYSDMWLEEYQLQGKNIIGQCHYDLFPEVPDKWKKIHQKCLKGQSEKSDADILEKADGKQDWFKWEIIPWYKYDIKTSKKSVAGIIMFAEIITPQIQEKILLEETKNRLDFALEGSKAGVWDWNIKSGKTNFSNRYKEILGYRENEFENTYEAWIEAVHPDDKQTTLNIMNDYINGKIPEYRTEFRMRTKKGNWKWILSRGKIVSGFNNEPIRMIGTHDDITDVKTKHFEFTQAQKMEAISRLVGGIAHDFNNQITIIKGNIDLLFSEENLSNTSKENIKSINNSLIKSEFLIKQLYSFSERPITDNKIININEKLKLIKPIFKLTFSDNITIGFDLDENLGDVKIDFSHLEQCLINIFNNANDAMPNGGTIKIITINDPRTDDEFIAIKDKDPADYIEIDISDSGTGMDPDVLERIYDPFFSTKEFGKGIGLGLAIVYNLVQNNDWLLDVKSIKNLGTVFRIFIPKYNPSKTELETKGTNSQTKLIDLKLKIDLKDYSILILEDEEDLRYVIGKMLAKRGFKKIFYAKDGVDGLKKWEESKTDINVILTDIVMPNMNGFEFANKIKTENPSIPIIYMTGYDKTHISIDSEKKITLINKPFSPSELTETIVSALIINSKLK